MMRRFGRNQKRKLIEQADMAMASAVAASANNAKAQEKLKVLRRWIDDTREAIAKVYGRNSVLLPMEAMALDGEIPETVRLMKFEALDVSPHWPDSSARLESLALETIRMAVNDHPGDGFGVHLECWGAGARSAYALSKTAIASMPPDVLARNLVRVFLPRLAEEFFRACRSNQ
jgi:hypothetical protein